MWLWISDNFYADVEMIWNSLNVVLKKNAEDAKDGTYELRGNIEENGNKKEIYI